LKLKMRAIPLRLQPSEWAVLAPFVVFCFVYPFALLLLSLDLMPFGMEWMSSLLLAMLGLAAGGWLWLNFGPGGALVAGEIFVLGLALEYVGATTGVPFGRYTYTGVLLPSLPGGVPLALGFAWLFIVVASMYTARSLLSGVRTAGWVVYLAGAGLAVGLDLLLEPVAYHVKGYWRWLDNAGGFDGVPWSNFVAWFLAALILGGLLNIGKGQRARFRLDWVPITLYAMNVLLFAVVNAAHGFWVSALIGLLLILLACVSIKNQITK
jgi:putative membrane protein